MRSHEDDAIARSFLEYGRLTKSRRILCTTCDLCTDVAAQFETLRLGLSEGWHVPKLPQSVGLLAHTEGK